ncbi:MAG: hypothetical protein ACR2PL_14875, partial [Dehalococcoidia bacterium]
MSLPQQPPRGVHLVGSVPLRNADEVFETASSILQGRLRRVPDGETGVRAGWIGWQSQVFAAHPQLEEVPRDPADYRRLTEFRIRNAAFPDSLSFSDLGYAKAAKDSYADFKRLKESGSIPEPYRFQVSLPTPLAPILGFVEPASQVAVEPAYESRLLAEVDEISATIPHDQLAIQWDTAVEFAVLEGVWPSFLMEPERQIVERLVRI